MSITKRPFGTYEGKEVDLYTLTNANGMSVSITTYGGAIVNLFTPDRDGNFADIILGFDDVDGYVGDDTYQGALIGRYCNRISGGKFPLNGKDYQLVVNFGDSHLHGGIKGYDKRIWNVLYTSDFTSPSISLTLRDEDGTEGYPGTVDVNVVYTLTEANELKLEYFATTDKTTILNMTNHSYFNLNGYDSGEILDNVIQLYTDKCTPPDADGVPMCGIMNVKGTALDLTTPKTVGEVVNLDDDLIKVANGLDHSFFYGRKGIMKHLATVYAPKTGRVIDAYSDQTAMQLYSGNFLTGVPGKNGSKLGFRNSICLETQYTPNSPNFDWAPSCVLNPGEEYHFTTVYKFSVK